MVKDKASLLELSKVTKLTSQANPLVTCDKTQITATAITSLATLTTYTRYQPCFWLPTFTQETLQPYIPLIMRYRDLYATHLIVATSHDVNLNNYGFVPFSIFDNEREVSGQISNIALWQFNLYDYKQLPDWINKDFWANPENWDKHRW